MSPPQLNEIEDFARRKLGALEARSLRRRLAPTVRGRFGAAQRQGSQLVSFCDNDYLGLSQHPDVKAAAAQAAVDHGVGAGASRLVVGDHPQNHALEARLAALKKLPAARVFGSGYLANLGCLPVLAGPSDCIVMDELSHACMHAGAKLSGAWVERYRHNDVDHLVQLLARPRQGRTLVVTETVFSMDGDLAPLGELAAACERYGAWLVTDDAHGFGVVELDNPAPIQLGTLSKAVGVYGGYVCGPAAFVELLASRARSLVYSTGLPPPLLAAALTSLEIMQSDPSLARAALRNARMFAELVALPPPRSAIVPLILGSAQAALDAAQALYALGWLVTAIRPPTVPDGAARLRFTFSAGHRESDVARLAAAVCGLREQRA